MPGQAGWNSRWMGGFCYSKIIGGMRSGPVWFGFGFGFCLARGWVGEGVRVLRVSGALRSVGWTG